MASGGTKPPMEKWYFTKEQLTNSPSRRCGIDADKELSYRQQAANFIQDLGQKLEVSQLCINTAIVYMHRFYVFHSMTQFHRNAIAAAAVFLAAKVEEQPRKLEHVIKMAHICLHRDQGPPDVRSEAYLEQAQDLVFNENALLQTLGFDVAIDHPHTHVVTCCQLVKASKDLAKTSYFMASNSLHLTTMCLQYKPTVVACFCIHLACKWSNWEIPQSTEGKSWFWYVDPTVTAELLQELTVEFLRIFDKCPSRLKRKIMSITATQSTRINHSLSNQPFDAEPRRTQSPALTSDAGTSSYHPNRPHQAEKQDERKQNVPGPSRASVEYREYREKREREHRLEREKPMAVTSVAQNHAAHYSHYHKTPVMMKQVSATTIPKIPHHNHHHRPDLKPGPVVPLRHGSQGRDPNRDPNRQRVPRDYNSSSGTSTDNSLHSHGHGMPKDPNLDNLLMDSGSHKSDAGQINSISHGNVQEKLNNNNHSAHKLTAIDKHLIHHEKRMHDPRRKPPVDHRKDSEQKPYNKYTTIDSTVPKLGKPEVEQRTEEVRKLIEKPLPPPKPTLDVAYGSSTQKPMHHAKYNQSEKVQSGLPIDPKFTTGSFLQEKSPTTSTSLFHQKPKATSQHAVHGVSQILKDTIRNGNSQPLSFTSLNNLDDPKTEKRLRHDETDGKSDQSVQQTPIKQKSLFSPEKIPPPRESHSQRPKNKQKTPPAAAKVPKQERVDASSIGFNLTSPFASPLRWQDAQPVKRSACDVPLSSYKKHRVGNTSDNAQVKVKEETSCFEAAKLHSRVPELIQPIRDNPPANGRAAQMANNMKPPDLTAPFEYEPLASHYGQNQPLTNGLDATFKSESQEFQMKREQCGKSDVPIKVDQIKSDYLSPLKSAQGISLLLQEPLAPMPSLLQNVPQYNQVPSQLHQEVAQTKPPPPQQQQHHPMSHSLLLAHHESMQMPLSSVNEPVIASTVDISAISGSVVTTAEAILSMPTSTTLAVAPPAEEKKSDHHKSEKKKKKEKHKHKDKDKSKERHKHKHKDKDKEKHREKDKEKSEEVVPAVPIKITIPKDKLNLSSESTMVNTGTGSMASSEKNKSPQNTSIKIIIPKERLKGTDSVSSSPQTSQSVVQAPLKIKISRSAPSTTSSGSNVSVGEFTNENNRKRDRSDVRDVPPTSAPPTKKQSQVPSTGYGQHRPGERQNGRHYSANNNKVRGGGRGGRPYAGRGRPPMAGSMGHYSAHRDGYYQQQDAYNNSNNARNNPYPPVRGDPGYWRTASGRPVGQTNTYDFANYPPMYPAGYMPYDPSSQLYYQQYQQQYAVYPAGHNVVMMSDGVIDTSVPPPSLPPNLRHNQSMIVASGRQEPKTPPPLPTGPPPSSSPPPPPPPENL